MDFTVCENCKHCDSSAKHSAYWLCMKHKRADGFGFVTTDKWDDKEPYLYCRHVNGGYCPLFEEAKNEQGKT